MPISAVEIEAYARLAGFTTDLSRRRLLNAVRAMDTAYLEWITRG